MPTDGRGSKPRKPTGDQIAASVLTPQGLTLKPSSLQLDPRFKQLIDASRIPIVVSPPTEAQTRLAYHRAYLESRGVTDLSALGTLSLSGAVAPQPGLTKPSQAVFGPKVAFQGAYAVDPNGWTAGPRPRPTVVKAGGIAQQLLAVSPAPTDLPKEMHPLLFSMPLPINVSYIVAQTLDLADNTTVILKAPVKALIILAEKVTVGQNVTITWERLTPDTLPAKPTPRPATPGTPPVSTTIAKPPAAPNGTDGHPGGVGPSGQDAPSIEIWTLAMTGQPVVDLRGQDGFAGGPGGDGGDGANGAPGRPDATNFLGICTSGPGNGGDGGTGGRAGDGGPGGNGGAGGNFAFYAPNPVITALGQQFYATVDGGQGGSGGIPGVPGSGGSGGPLQVLHGCSPAAGDVRTPGAAGHQGAPGNQGAFGQAGPHGAVSLNPIDPDDYRRQLEKPALISFSTQYVRMGDWVTINGLRFTHTDVVWMGGHPCPTNVSSDVMVTFQVPLVWGGSQRVEVRQADGTVSNPGTLYVLPTVGGSAPGNRVRPGSTVTLTGTGFAPGMRVQVNGEDMPGVRFVDAANATFTVVRPASVQPNPAGEAVTIRAVLADGTASNPISLTLDTFRILVMGDSIAWGQGLLDNQKYSGRVEAAVRAQHGEIGVYRTIAAHSGAIIGLKPQRDNTPLPAIDGEVPTSYPTVAQQLDTLAAMPDAGEVDLILMDGGINDVDVRNILNPTTTAATLTGLVQTHCHDAMLELLKATAQKFPKAKIIVTGYYQILSDQSDQTRIMAFCMAAGLAVGGIPGALVAGVLTEAALQSIISNCALFATQGNMQLQMAVNDANAATPGPTRISFADPMLTAANAAMAPQAFIYGINLDFSPEDDNAVAGPRAGACQLNANRTDVTACQRASVGHPNPKGAEAYAKAILPLI